MPGPSRSSFRSQYSVLDADTPRIRGVPRIRVSVCGDVACMICIFPEHMGAIIVGGGPAPFEACRVHGSGCARWSVRSASCASRIAFIERFVSVRAHSTPKVCVFSILAPAASFHPSQWRVRRFDGRKGGPSGCRAYRDVVGATAPSGERDVA